MTETRVITGPQPYFTAGSTQTYPATAVGWSVSRTPDVYDDLARALCSLAAALRDMAEASR